MNNASGPTPFESRFVAHLVNQLTARTYLVTLGMAVKTEEAVTVAADAAKPLYENVVLGIRNGATELSMFLAPLS